MTSFKDTVRAIARTEGPGPALLVCADIEAAVRVFLDSTDDPLEREAAEVVLGAVVGARASIRDTTPS